jgi:hypothetical protein
MNICIIGCITKYGPDDIRNYVNSIINSGFIGRKIMMVYDVPQSTTSFLKENGWEVYEGELHQHIILQRFFDISNLCDVLTDDVLIWTDVKDVIFQSDPRDWLNKYMYSPILATSETILFKDEEWAVVNAGTSFPVEWSWLQDKISYCAGVIVGKREYMRDLFNEIYRWSLTTSNPEQLSDQAAFNVLINLKHFQNDVQFVEQNSGLVTHMGVSWVKQHTHKNKLTELPPVVTSDGLVCTPDGTPFCIVHQYDRDHHLKLLVNNKYA